MPIKWNSLFQTLDFQWLLHATLAAWSGTTPRQWSHFQFVQEVGYAKTTLLHVRTNQKSPQRVISHCQSFCCLYLPEEHSWKAETDTFRVSMVFHEHSWQFHPTLHSTKHFKVDRPKRHLLPAAIVVWSQPLLPFENQTTSIALSRLVPRRALPYVWGRD